MPVLPASFVIYGRFGVELVSNQTNRKPQQVLEGSSEMASRYYRKRTDRQLTTNLCTSFP